jgi:hypothetical protein
MHCHFRTKGNKVYVWEVARLWEEAANLEVKELALSQLDKAMNKDYWFRRQPSTLRNVMRHYIRVAKADLSYPIILDADGVIFDGVHRLAKAYMLGEETIKVVQFTTSPLHDREFAKPQSLSNKIH